MIKATFGRCGALYRACSQTSIEVHFDMFAETAEYGDWFFPILEGEGRGPRDLAFVVRIDSSEERHVEAVCERINVWSRAVNRLSVAETGWASSVVCDEGQVSWAWVAANKMLGRETFARDVALLPEMLVGIGEYSFDFDGPGPTSPVWNPAPIRAMYVLTTLEAHLDADEEPQPADSGGAAVDSIPFTVGPIDDVAEAEVVLCMREWSMATVDELRAVLLEFLWNDVHRTWPGPLTVAGHEGQPGMIQFGLKGSFEAGVQLHPDISGFVHALHGRLQDLTDPAANETPRIGSMTVRPLG